MLAVSSYQSPGKRSDPTKAYMCGLQRLILRRSISSNAISPIGGRGSALKMSARSSRSSFERFVIEASILARRCTARSPRSANRLILVLSMAYSTTLVVGAAEAFAVSCPPESGRRGNCCHTGDDLGRGPRGILCRRRPTLAKAFA